MTPEDTVLLTRLREYSDWDDFRWGERIEEAADRLEALAAEVERLTKERDEARAAERAAVADYGGNVSLNQTLERTQAHVALLREAIKKNGAHNPSCDMLLIVATDPPRRYPCSCWIADVLAATAEDSEAFLAQHDRQVVATITGRDDCRLVRISTDVVSQWGARDREGWRLDYGFQDLEDGTAHLVVTRTDDGFLAKVRREVLERAAQRYREMAGDEKPRLMLERNTLAWCADDLDARALAAQETKEPGVTTAVASKPSEEASDGGRVAPSESPLRAAPGSLPGAPEAPK